MSSLSSTTLSKPKNWQDFERSTRELFAFLLGDPTTQMHGRGGQPQHGVDVYGYRDRDPKQLVGVQCKLSDDPITEEELTAELNKAKKFKPPITEFFLVTTAPRDEKIQAAVRTLTASLSESSRPLFVYVWGWQDIEEQASKSTDVWNTFDPTYNPYAKRAHEETSLKLEAIYQKVQFLDSTVSRETVASSILPVTTSEDTPLHGKITTCQALVDDGHAKTAFDQLKKIRELEWSTATTSERYRLLVTMASAQLEVGKQTEAGQLLLDAFLECPSHRKAHLNRAKGFLLTHRDSQAAESTREILKADPGNADAAGTLIQALIGNEACSNPLEDIPADLRETPEVLVAHISFLRSRGIQDWIELAQRAAKLFPENKFLKQFGAEAILENTIISNPDAIAGASLDDPENFKRSIETLYSSAREAIQKDDPSIAPFAHNAALGLRVLGDYGRAKEILDAALERFPADENLQLQRSLVAYVEGDMPTILKTLPKNPTNPEAAGVLADAYISSGNAEEALKLLDGFGVPESDFLKLGFAATKIHAYLALEDQSQAIDVAKHLVQSKQDNTGFKTLLVRVLRLTRRVEDARIAMGDALATVGETTPLATRFELAWDAHRMGFHNIVLTLLKDRVATDRESPALKLLISAAINGNFPVAAKEVLESVGESLRGEEWFLQADAVLVLNVGDSSADAKIGRYLKAQPNDLDMILSRVSLWQRDSRDEDIRRLLKGLSLKEITGSARQLMQLSALIIHYHDPAVGLELGYSTLLNNWHEADAHLSYNGLLLGNSRVSGLLLKADKVHENNVVTLETEEGQVRRYRIEGVAHQVFGEEFITPDHPLAKALLGKKIGDEILPHDHLGARPLKVIGIKSKYLDVLHRSLDEFNERFPRSTELLKFTFDSKADDPLVEMREVTKARAEASLKLLEQYKAQVLPLAFVGAVLGLDPLEAWGGLASTDFRFQVCLGTAPEREEALKILTQRDPVGCVVDVITLSIIRHIKAESAVAEICGPVCTTQSVIDLLRFRVAEAEQWRGKEQGAIVWQDGELRLEKYNEEHWDRIIADRRIELNWAQESLRVVPAMPSTDLSDDSRQVANLFKGYATDPAVAAQGSQYLLLSDDMGFRNWGAQALHVEASWTQPVLMIARDRGLLSVADYSEAINTLALNKHVYVSLDAGSLFYQARKSDFQVTAELSRLLQAVGGPNADLLANPNVLAKFIDLCWADGTEPIKVLRIASEAFAALTDGRLQDQREIVGLIASRLQQKQPVMARHALEWLIGHSLGLPYFDELVAERKGLH